MIKDIFHRSPKNKVSHRNKDMINSSTVLIETAEPIEMTSAATNNNAKHDICLVSDSPHYIVRVR
jgi:hypothetical protein